MTIHKYTAYGLHFESSISLPGLLSANFGQPDVIIHYAEIAESLPEPCARGKKWQTAPGRVLLSVEGVARYLVVENREIRIHPFPGSTEADVRVFLLGSVLGALLHARRMLVLHSSVICTERGAVLFAGRSGVGKSTLLGAFLQRGYSMLADDKAGITLNEDGVPQAMPGFPLIRLTEDAVKMLQYPLEGCNLQLGLGKYVVPVAQFQATAVPLCAVYLLGVHKRPDIRLEPLQTMVQFQLLNRQTYRWQFLTHHDQRQSHLQILGAVSHHSKVARVLRPDSFLVDELCACIERDLALGLCSEKWLPWTHR